MRTRRLWCGLLATLAVAGLPAPGGAQPVGSEFQVNTYTTKSQYTSSDHTIAADANGNFVVVWASDTQDGDDEGVFGQRYDSEGAARGDEFRVNSGTRGDQETPAVASDASGNFIVVWRSDPRAESEDAILGQRYDSMGGAIGSEFQINSSTLERQEHPSVASDANGNFVVVWDCTNGYNRCGVFGQRFDSQGAPRGGEFVVNPGPGLTAEGDPHIASDPSGGFVIVWVNGGYDGREIYGQRYDSEGIPQGSRFRVNSSPQYVHAPSVASDASGAFVVVWSGPDGDSYGILGQRYDSAGVALGGEFHVNSYSTLKQTNASVSASADGGFVVVWQSESQDGDSFGTFGRRYDSGGNAQGGEFQVNSYTTEDQASPSVAIAGANHFVVTWWSEAQDGDLLGVFGRRFAFESAETVTVVSPNTNVRWRIGSLRRIQWTHDLGLDATFRIELDRDDDGSYEELIAAAAQADSATRGHFGWTVTGPPSGTARVRVLWTDDLSVSDASDVTFQIRPAPLGGER